MPPFMEGRSGRASGFWVSIANGTTRAGARYGATWTFQRNLDVELQKPITDLLPLFMVEYGHRDRFTVQAFGSCGDPGRTWPNRSVEWSRY